MESALPNPLNAAARPFGHGQRAARPDAAVLYVLSLPLAACVGYFCEARIAGFYLTGWIWLTLLVAGIFLLLLRAALHHELPARFPRWPWLIWLGYVFVSLLWCDDVKQGNIQEAIQIGMPLLVGAAAAEFVRSRAQLRLLLRMFGVAAVLLGAAEVARRLGMCADPEEQGNRALALTAGLVGCVFVAASPPRHVTALLGWTACLGITFATGSRIATFSLLVAPIFHPLYRSVVLRGGMILVMAGSAVWTFNTPTFQARFFTSGSGTLADVYRGDFVSSGRLEVWPLVWDQAWRHPIAGAGVGSSSDFIETIWPDAGHVHNDYLRVGFELGFLGLALFLAIIVWQLTDLKRKIRQTRGITRQAFAAAFLGIIVFMVDATTDNVLLYNLPYTNPLFALMGAAYGVASREGTLQEGPFPAGRSPGRHG